MRKNVFLMLLFFHVSSSEKHSLKLSAATFSGILNFPDFLGAAEVDGVEAAYCYSNKTLKLKQDWFKTVIETGPYQEAWYSSQCSEMQPNFLKARMHRVMQSLNRSKGVHILQMIIVCEWDDETEQVEGFLKYAFDGEDFISFNEKNLTWIALKQEAVATKMSWDTEKSRINNNKLYFTQVFPGLLKEYVDVGKSALLRKVLPSVSLLQKSPSSLVSCHASGFYPDRAVLFWRKDGEKLFEDVEHGEILPNHDGTFQMSVDLLKAPPEDWGRYECVFQLSGLKEDIITKLNKDVIRTNHEDPTDVSIVVIGILLLVVLLLLAAVVGFVFHRRRKGTKTRTENPETLNLKTLPMNASSCTEKHREETLNTQS